MSPYRLAIVDGSGSSRELDLDEPLEVGRDPGASIVIEDDLVSRRHARLIPGDDGVLVEDLGSRNGTHVNGRRLDAAAVAGVGDRIAVGQTVIEVRETPQPGYLLLVRGDPAVRVPLSAPLEIGREAAAGVSLVDDLLVSNRHARLTPSGEGARVEDLGSRNGTFVNGLRVEEPVIARPGDRILVGACEFEVHALPRPAHVLALVASPERPPLVLVEQAEIGRDPDAELALPDDELVSFRHARVVPGPERPQIQDLGSSNGTFVNGRRITEPTPLEVGDRIIVGVSELEVRQAPAESTPTLVRPPEAVTAESAVPVAGDEPPEGVTLVRRPDDALPL